MSGDLADLKKQLASCLRDLATMPAHKAGTEWHTDRIEERNWLNRAIARKEGWAPESH
jgi:hypothetical protein